VVESEEERTRLPRDDTPMEEKRKRRRGRSEPDEVCHLLAAGQCLEKRFNGAPLMLPFLLLRDSGWDGLAPRHRFGPISGRRGWIGC
jgi:hypothetical protein